jgi:excisionase family DNA binding protein
MSLQNADPEQFLTVAEVAEMLKLNQQTVRNWIDQGSLPALRIGRRVRILRQYNLRIPRPMIPAFCPPGNGNRRGKERGGRPALKGKTLLFVYFCWRSMPAIPWCGRGRLP